MVLGTATKDAIFKDDMGKEVSVTLSVRDIILFKLIERLTDALRQLA